MFRTKEDSCLIGTEVCEFLATVFHLEALIAVWNLRRGRIVDIYLLVMIYLNLHCGVYKMGYCGFYSAY